MCGFLVYEGRKEELTGFDQNFDRLIHRGPDARRLWEGRVTFGFHRLAIMDLSQQGDQPFQAEQLVMVCNGEIYNDETLRALYPFDYQSHSDCEVLLPLFNKLGLKKMVQALDGEYAFALFDQKTQKLMAARDPLGIRPLFYGRTGQGKLMLASEAKAIQAYCPEVYPFPPGHLWDGDRFYCFSDPAEVRKFHRSHRPEILRNVNSFLQQAVVKRLKSDAPLGFLLSGGLDSSLVCALAQRHLSKPIRTFAVGMEEDPIDLKYAQEVADYIGSDHTEIRITPSMIESTLPELIYHLETFDITTIRAAMGMYLLCRSIHQHTDIKVILTGEVSDELFGYKYTDFAPSPQAFQEEAQKRIREIYMFDVLRADRCISAHSLEARVPFSDHAFVDYVMAIPPELKMNRTGMGKYLLREAFAQEKLLPESILWREKAAFSDAVGHGLVDHLKAMAEKKYTLEDLLMAKGRYTHAPPFTKESLMYREIFESFFPTGAGWIPHYWMPNQEWQNCQVNDPSARVLPNYGKSGS